MRRGSEMLVIVLLLAACGGATGQDLPSTDAPEAPEVETSREPRPGRFVPTRPTEQQGALYLTYADLTLAETPWTMDRMGQQAWGTMLIDGAVVACRSYHAGATTREAMETALASSPHGSDTPTADDTDAYDLLSVFFIGGVDAFCPTLVDDIYGTLLAIPLDDAWEQMTGGPPPDRPIRTP